MLVGVIVSIPFHSDISLNQVHLSNVFHQLNIIQSTRLTSNTTVGFIPLILVRHSSISLQINLTLLVDDNMALTRDFVRGSHGSRTTPYYIWIPYLLIAAACCAYLPAWLWHTVGHRATFDIPAMINHVARTKLNNVIERRTMLRKLAEHYKKAHRYGKSNGHILQTCLRKSMFFAGEGLVTGRNPISYTKIFLSFF